MNAGETYLRFLAEYFNGRALANNGDQLAAVEAFRRAEAIVPHARSSSTHLAAALLTLGRAGEREEAYRVLHLAYAGLTPVDPWRLYGKGDARLRPVYMARLRAALQ
jgi:hypothetical protein